MKNNAVIIFAKYPEPGKVKTRLAKDIGKKNASELYKAMLRDIAENVSQSQAYDVGLCFSPQTKKKQFYNLLRIKNMHPQRSGNLGDTIEACFMHFFQEYGRIVVIGSDIPTINKTVINQAFSKLKTKDIVLGRAADGGYYLIGMKELHNIFNNVEWSTESVLAQTLKNIESKKLSYALLPPITEIDTIKDLMQLRKTISKKGSIRTFDVIAKLR